jgi:hypothetical protein
MNAIESKDHEHFTAARIAFQRDERFLHLELPNGRHIRYPYPRLYENIGFDGNPRRSFTFRDASGGRWEWYHILKKRGAFGGLIAENATQAICRDVFCDAMLRLEAANYHVVAHLHDQFVCEVAEGFGSLEEFIAIITAPPAWAPDFPIAAKGRITDRLIEIKEPKASTPVNNDVRPPPDDDEEPAPVDEIVEPLPWEEPEPLAAAGTVNPDPPLPPLHHRQRSLRRLPRKKRNRRLETAAAALKASTTSRSAAPAPRGIPTPAAGQQEARRRRRTSTKTRKAGCT